jgi:hypothetical protein
MDRRTFLAGSTAMAAACTLGLRRASAQYPLDRVVNQLIAMDDMPVRKQVGTIFDQHLRASSEVRDTFFANAATPDFAPPNMSGLSGFVGDTAVSLVCWSLAHTSEHGFAQTVDETRSKAKLSACLSPGNGTFRMFSTGVYDHYFPELCRTADLKFGDAIGKPDIGKLFCQTVSSTQFRVKTMQRWGADPGDFKQYVRLIYYKADLLAPGTPELAEVVRAWQGDLAGGDLATYQFMERGHFSEQTFMTEVKAAIEQATEYGKHSTGTFCQASSGRCHTSWQPDYFYGVSVANWLDRQKGKYAGIVTGQGPDNRG